MPHRLVALQARGNAAERVVQYGINLMSIRVNSVIRVARVYRIYYSLILSFFFSSAPMGFIVNTFLLFVVCFTTT